MKHKKKSTRHSIKRYENKSLLVELLGGRCSRCGYKGRHRALHFHHIGEKRFTINDILGHSTEKVLREAKNCELLCANCHQKEHSKWSKDISDIKSMWHWRKLALYQAFGMKCSVCSSDEIAVLQFHHINPNQKKANLSSRVTLEKAPSLIWREALKCALVCANCHAEIEDDANQGAVSTLMIAAPHNSIQFQDWLVLIDRVQYKHEIKNFRIAVTGRVKPSLCIDCGVDIDRKAKRCIACSRLHRMKIDWPSTTEIIQMVEQEGYSAVGRTLGVSCNAVRKHLANNS